MREDEDADVGRSNAQRRHWSRRRQRKSQTEDEEPVSLPIALRMLGAQLAKSHGGRSPGDQTKPALWMQS